MRDSSIIRDIQYSNASKELYVQMEYPMNHPWYVYSNVPDNVAQEFKRAPSLGVYFNLNIKPNYQSRKV